MYSLNDLTIVVPSNVINIKESWIKQINKYALLGIKVIISIPPEITKKELFKKGFINQINVINAEFRGQVKQRIIAYKYCDSELIMHMDDDIILDIQILKNLINDYSLLPEKSCFAPYLCEYSSQGQNNLFRRLKDSILFFGISKKFGTVGTSSFPIPYKRFEKSKFSEVDWIPGGLLLIRKKDCLDYDYFNLPGKAYCEDLIHSQLLRNKGVRLFISNTCSYYTKVAKYKDLGLIYFLSYIKNDFIARNYYRKIIKNPFLPMLNTYFFIINYYFFYKLVKLIIRTLNIPNKLFRIKK